MSTEPSTEPRLSTSEVEAIFRSLGPADWRRASVLAAAAAAGLADWSPEDLLHEAVTKLMEGVRTCPVGVPPTVMLASVMHSIASNERERSNNSPVAVGVRVAHVDSDDEDDDPQPVVHGESVSTPARIVEHRELLAAIDDLVKDEEQLRYLVMAWAEGSRGDEACEVLGWDTKTHDAARKRLTRRLGSLAT
jgi:DNA-directed RNA polymerase specialized sigma24 family protein